MNDNPLLNEVSDREVELLGTKLCKCTIEEGVNLIDDAISSGGKYRVIIRNAACINLSFANEEYRDAVAGYHMRFVDGIGVYLAGKILKGIGFPDLGGNPFGRAILQRCAEKGYRVYLLGAKQEVVAKAAENFQKWHHGLKIAGYHHGYFDLENCGDIIEEINKTEPDLVMACFGKPEEVFWIARNFDSLRAKVMIPMGGFFDFQSGHTRRAPEWILKMRFEWLFRLLIEPRRLWRRYIIGNTIFMTRVFRYKLFGK
ncbi:MAG: WecB/TagA/CpsF family glycosyltransferase [candidate division Zixibacteria bacterium]|nr:WecB/TagA/CpsF family glycosyltransferase [candidate division Zixibacteria bacterium]